MSFLKVLAFVLTFFFIVSSYSQIENRAGKYISTKVSKGFIYIQNPTYNYIVDDYISTFEINYSKTVDGKKKWQRIYSYPTLGISYHYFNFGNPLQLGNANVISPYASFVVFNKKKMKLAVEFATGVAWISKRFDLSENKYNLAIGSNLNAYLNIGAEIDLRLLKRLNLLVGIDVTHFSNGDTQKPNNSLNIISFQTGIKYLIYQPVCKELEPIKTMTSNKEFSIIYSACLKSIDPIKTKKYYVSGISFNYENQFFNKGRYGVGIDVFRDNSRKETLLQEGYESVKTTNLYYAGGHISYDFVFGNTSFYVQAGVYFWQKSSKNEYFYNRLGLKYRFLKHWMANISLKGFLVETDFAEWGIGYRF